MLLIERFSELGGRHTASDKNIQRRKMQKTGAAAPPVLSEMVLVDLMVAVCVDISMDH